MAEYAYCRRLFYFMEVEGIHLPSDDTELGNRVHRRVDEPSSERTVQAAADGDAPKTVRSLTLISQSLGLTATLGLAEINGCVAVPVEYRKGKPHHITLPADDDSDLVEPWPTDRIQIGLQAILLEESGYTVPQAILYYAAEKRRLAIPFDQSLRDAVMATLEAAKSAACGPRPLPLINDPRCPRCSLQPICLPDEINNQREAIDGNSNAAPRKMWPPRDDGIHLVAQQDGVKLGVRGGAVVVSDKEGKRLKEVPLACLESLSLLGSVQLSTQAIQTLADRGIPVAYLTAGGRLVAMLDPLDSVSANTRRAQVRRFDDPMACLELSRA